MVVSITTMNSKQVIKKLAVDGWFLARSKVPTTNSSIRPSQV